ncbi:MAG: ribulose-phosphate 3-epimerase [Candidatus Aminicenantes bacterium]|nr:MAG: ribulose-phosphate 3-epimerase [Candidatus Aminicenantes bacterium]
MIQIAPSILSADFSKISDAVKIAEESGADLIHVDVMDGHFVPNLTFGPQLVASLRKKTSLPLDVHLMVDNPRSFIPLFAKAGADWISIHVEASVHLHKDITLIKEYDKKAGLALNPATPLPLMNEILEELDFVLLMTVNPGWGGQEFIQSCHSKISQLRSWIREQKLEIPIQIDGGVSLSNMEELIKDGADILVVGSAVFGEKNPREAITKMKKLAEKTGQP